MIKAPMWQTVFFFGVPFGVLFGVFLALTDEDAKAATITGVCSGLVFGVAMALIFRRQRNDWAGILDDVPEDDWKATQRAAWRGPAPADPRLRTAALQLAETNLRRMQKYRTLVCIVFGLNLVLSIVQVSLHFSILRLILVAIWLFALLSQAWYYPRRLRARVAELSAVQR
jgi:hypothetical protein